MLTRVYIDNFLAFVNFEYRPAPKQLILGGNGSGKSSFFDALMAVHCFAIRGEKLDDIFMSNLRTRWLRKLEQTFEIEAELNGHRYIYRLVLSADEKHAQVIVLAEEVFFEGKPIFEFQKGEVKLYNDQFERTTVYPFDSRRSAFETINGSNGNKLLSGFKAWLAGLSYFRINPYAMGFQAKKAEPFPVYDLSNFAGWLATIWYTDRMAFQRISDSLQDAISGFLGFRFENFRADDGEIKGSYLCVDFHQEDGNRLSFDVRELSDGQKCLVCLYTILHFVVEKGHTVIIDEPDNFISLREIQPWLRALSDVIEDGQGQVILVSHHPELIDRWAPRNGVRFVRDGMGPIRVEKFHGDPDSILTPSELVARGWED